MDKARFVVLAHVNEGRPVLELAAEHAVHFSWIYRLLARYDAEGEAGLERRSRRPKSSPRALSGALEDEIVRIRKQLSEDGLDAGPQTIWVHVERRHGSRAPSVSTIARVLARRGLVERNDKKRPKSSYHCFEAELPNECWQTDMTHVELADGAHAEVVNFLDDHSRLCVASVAVEVAKTTDVVWVFHQARATFGTPGVGLERQRGHLHRQVPLGEGALRVRTRSPGRGVQALETQPSGRFKGSTQLLGGSTTLR